VPIEVFISHSARDADAAAALIRVLRSALVLPATAIRCTSVDGYRLPGGADTNSRLRQEVNEADALLGIISATSLRSLYVVFDLARAGERQSRSFHSLLRELQRRSSAAPSLASTRCDSITSSRCSSCCPTSRRNWAAPLSRQPSTRTNSMHSAPRWTSFNVRRLSPVCKQRRFRLAALRRAAGSTFSPTG